MKSDWNPDSAEVTRDQVAAYDEMRERCPVAYSDLFGWSVFRHADVMQVLNDHETFSNHVSQHLSVPNGMDPPEHTKYRRIIESYFSPAKMAAFEPTCRKITAQLLAEVAARGNDVEVMNDLASQFAARIQCAFLGWPASLHEALLRWVADHHDAVRRADREALSTLARQLEAIVDGLIEQRIEQRIERRTERRTERRIERRIVSGAEAVDDVTASLMQESVGESVGGRPLSSEEISSILRNWTVGEMGTISASIGILIHHLAHQAEHQARLRQDGSLLPNAIDEILRVHNPLHSSRRVTTCPVRLGDRQIEAGQTITLNWIAANRDEAVFEDADTVKLDRDPKDNLLYGAGIHICPGAPLARMELRVLLEQLFAWTTAIEFQPHATSTLASYPSSGFSSLPIRLQWKRRLPEI